MRCLTLKTIFKTAGLAVALVLLTTGASYAQVALTAQPTTVTLPDGNVVPMWGLFCAPGSNTDPTVGPTCTALTGLAQNGTTWQPPLIRATTGSTLTINLTNHLPSPVPTSLIIVGQLGGGLGSPSKVNSPTHAVQGTTWPVAGDTSGPVFTPPSQPQRIQSFGTEVIQGTPQSLPSWNGLKAGTYLIESGTHPSIQGPMGLFGVLIVSDSATEAFPGVTYDADVPLLLSEIDARLNGAIAAAVATPGFSETSVRVLRDTVSSVTVALDNAGNPIAGTGYVVGDPILFTGGGFTVSAVAAVSSVDGSGAITGIAVSNPGQGYSSAPSVSVSSATGSGAQVVAALSLAGTMCSDGAAACYPPAVNYDPRYYLINGVAFDKTNVAASTFTGAGATATTGTVMLRFANAGLRMHVPSVVGLNLSLIAEDGNVLPGIPKIQNEVFLAAGKTYDVSVKPTQTVAGTYDARTYPVFDRQLSLSTNNQRDGGMQAYFTAGGGAAAPTGPTVTAVDDNYFLTPGKTLTISDPAKGLLANDHNVYGVIVTSGPSGQAPSGFTWYPDGTFTYTPATGTTSDSFTYAAANSPLITATVHLNACTGACLGTAPVANPDDYTSNIATVLHITPAGVLANDTNADGYPMTAALQPCAALTGYTCLSSTQVDLQPDGSFTVHVPAAGNYNFTYQAVQSHGLASANANVTLHFLTPSNLQVRVLDGPSTLPGNTPVQLTDYRWIIEEDRTFHIDSASQVNVGTYVPNLGANFFTSYMPVVAQGCVGTVACEAQQTVLDPTSGAHLPAVCDIGNGACRTTATQEEPVDPGLVHLDPTKQYYLSVLPGDSINPTIQGSGGPQPVDPANPNGPQRQFSIPLDCPTVADFAPGTGKCGHGMGGAPINPGQLAVDVKVQQTPFPPGKISVFVFEDDNPLNGEVDAGGGVDVLATNEPGLGGFAITLLDAAGGLGDSTGQPTYDMFNMPLSNSLAGMRDPVTGLDSCPISPNSTDGLVGMIVTCPKYESDGQTLSPLAGQAVIDNLYPGLYEVVATPGADRIARGEEWLQTNTLDGTKPLEAFVRIGEPGYFQEFGPAGYHVMLGFANPAIINARRPGVCDSLPAGSCSHAVSGQISDARISRTPDERIYGTGNYDAFSFTQCYVSLGDPAAADFAFTKCNPDGTFTFTGIPPGNHRITIFDQWNDIIVDGLSLPIAVPTTGDLNLGELPMMQWRTNLTTRTFLDVNRDGISQDTEPGLPLVPINIRYRDGSFTSFNNSTMDGTASYNEIFPFFNWLMLESDTTRYKNTGTHVVYDAGGPADGTGSPDAGNSAIASHIANTKETFPLPTDLRVPGAVYCADADCTTESLLTLPSGGGPGGSTGRIDPAWVTSEAWQGFAGEYQIFEFGKAPYALGENGGIHGHVVYASTRPFDDPQMLIQNFWEPLVPNVTVNLYRKDEGAAPDGSDKLTLIDTTKTTSWDNWAQGFHTGPNGTPVPNMNCPGQDPTSPFYFTLKNTPNYLNPGTPLPYNSQFKCYDGMAMLNQVQPAPYDGMYQFPSVTSQDPLTGLPTGTNCTACTTNPADSTPMLAPGKYVVEVIVPPGYELVKEEDKNILLGDVFIAPVTQQFATLVNIFILPDQAEVDSEYNPYNPQNPTDDLGQTPRHEGDTGSKESKWPCVGQARIVPDFMSLDPMSMQVAPFAGATRHLCDRKEVTLEDQMSVLAKFYIFTSTNVASHMTGVVTDDYASEFDPFSPAYGEKLAIPNLPISFKDASGNEISRAYTDQWGFYNGLYYSTWEVNPPNPTGYGPQVVIACMNDPGPIPDPAHPGQMMMDPLYNPGYSDFCYEWSLMPGATAYMDTPVVPVMAFAEGYNPPDCAYPNATPAVRLVNGDGDGPWVANSDNRGSVVSLTLTGGGSNYTSAPTVTFTGGGGEGAAATDTLRVNSVTVSNSQRGSGYTGVPTVGFSGGGGSGAAATANMRVGSITVTSPGSGYTSRPAVNLTGGGGSGAAVSSSGVTLQVVSVSVTNAGNCYAAPPTVNFSSGGGSGAAATSSLSGGKVSGVTVTAGGSYTGVPTVTFQNGPYLTGCSPQTRAAGTAKMGVGTITPTSPGSGYTSQPTVAVAPPPSGTGNSTATAVAFLSLNSVAVTAGGSGYTSSPTVVTNGGGGTGATGTAFMAVNSLTLTSGGIDYSTAPSVGFSGGGGSGASATATLGPRTAHSLTILALGDVQVPNDAYSGPQATTAPFNQKFITRHYGFGATQGTGTVKIDGRNAPVTSWSDTQITVKVPGSVSACTIQQRNAPYAACGQMVITTGSGAQSVDAVTVTIGGKPPTYVSGENAAGNAIQSAMDAAAPGDLIMLRPGIYPEMTIMWKPVRLQGVGAASVTIDANPRPSVKLDVWRKKIQCLFGLGQNGRPGTDSCDDVSQSFQVDRIPLEGILGWDTTVNGNLAELLQEPTIMGAYEGAGVAVLAKGVRYPPGVDPYGTGAEAGFPAGTVLLTNSDQDCNDFPGNFVCNPSRIDGVTITNSSQGGGGIFTHGWTHYLEISNNRIFANAGTGSGGITIGQGEFGDPNIAPQTGAVPPLTTAQFPALNTVPAGTELPYWLQAYVNVHNNSITQNASYGDSLYSWTPAGAGGATFYTGSDYYKFNYNWVCGNLSSGDGGGVAHLGFSYNDANGGITHNSILFNQSSNPSVPTQGGGLLISGAGPDGSTYQCANSTGTGGSGQTCTGPSDTRCPTGETCQLLECGTITDTDCPPGLSEGVGPGLVVDSNLIQGNSADSGSGGGVRFQLVNGAEVGSFPTAPANWYGVNFTNNVVVDNVAGWDGGGVSMQDALKVNFVNNSVLRNDSTAAAGILFSAFGAPSASTPPTTPPTCNGCTTSPNQVAGLVTMINTPNLTSSLPAGGITCPSIATGNPANPYPAGNCGQVSMPVLANNVFWQNRTFYIQVAAPTSSGLTGQQSSVSLIPTLNQTATGQCVTGAQYWDIGVRGDLSATSHNSGFTLNPQRSILTSTAGYASSNLQADPAVANQYCDGSRVPPENGGMGYLVPPGVAQENMPPPVFSLTPSATVDEANNWINISWGPLSLFNSAGAGLGNYVPGASSAPTVNAIPNSGTNVPFYNLAPAFDFFGTARKASGFCSGTTTQTCTASSQCPSGQTCQIAVDIGAVEYPAAGVAP